MTDLRCRNCGMRATYADANIADLGRTCGAVLRPDNTTDSGIAAGGSKHDWTEV